jgi:hypothetical protein
VVTVPETGKTLGGGFLVYWEANGGRETFGYPITDELSERDAGDGQTRTVQYFERARFEYHPEHQSTPYETQLGLLGRLTTAGRADERAFQPVADPAQPEVRYFPETRHTVSGSLREHWEATGATTIYGLPISEPLQESWRKGGTEYTVQYFERARLEYHPEAAGLRPVVLASRLGTQQLTRQPPPRLGGG